MVLCYRNSTYSVVGNKRRITFRCIDIRNKNIQ